MAPLDLFLKGAEEGVFETPEVGANTTAGLQEAVNDYSVAVPPRPPLQGLLGNSEEKSEDTPLQKAAILLPLATAAIGGRIAGEDTPDKKTPPGEVSFWGKLKSPLASGVSSGLGMSGGKGGVLGGMAMAVKGKDESAIEEDALDELFDPEHETELRSIKTQAMLSEFMSVDPVISTYDPDQVLDAYNQVVQLMPRAAQQPAAMRGLIRKMLQQQDALEPFEIEQMTKIENTMKSLEEPDTPPLSPLTATAQRAGVLQPPAKANILHQT